MTSMTDKKGFSGCAKLLLGVFITFLISGCSVVLDKTIALPKVPIPEDQKATVAVLPFEHVAPELDPEEEQPTEPQKPINREMQKFERHYFPARLVQTLRKSPWVSGAYVSPGATPAVDYLIKGAVTESDGEVTEITITLTRCCWTDSFTETFRIDSWSGHFEKMNDPSQMGWNTIVNAIGRHFEQGDSGSPAASLLKALGQPATTAQAAKPQDLVIERVSAYLGNRTRSAPVTARIARTVQKAAKWERDNLLDRVSKMELAFAEEAQPAYIKWQGKVTKLVEEKRRHDFTAGVSAIAMVANIGMGMYASSQGAGSLGSELTESAVTNYLDFEQASEESKVIGESMTKMTHVFSSNLEPQTIDLEGRVYKLTGDVTSRIAQLKKIVRDVISLELER